MGLIKLMKTIAEESRKEEAKERQYANLLNARIDLRVKQDEKEKIITLAKNNNLNISNYIRWSLLGQNKVELKFSKDELELLNELANFKRLDLDSYIKTIILKHVDTFFKQA